jgi:hypothetical protein
MEQVLQTCIAQGTKGVAALIQLLELLGSVLKQLTVLWAELRPGGAAAEQHLGSAGGALPYETLWLAFVFDIAWPDHGARCGVG